MRGYVYGYKRMIRFMGVWDGGLRGNGCKSSRLVCREWVFLVCAIWLSLVARKVVRGLRSCEPIGLFKEGSAFRKVR